jgi:ParB-like chromosome segregation protein Spo0J
MAKKIKATASTPTGSKRSNQMNASSDHTAQLAHSQSETVDITSLEFDSNNTRIHPVANIETLKKSLERFGQQKPIVVSKDNIVLAGNGTLQAAKALGWKTIVIWRSELTGMEATAYSIADNRASELASWNEQALAQQLNDLQLFEADLVAATGFEPQAVADLMRTLEPAIVRDNAKSKEIDVVSGSFQHTCPRCKFEWSEQ